MEHLSIPSWASPMVQMIKNLPAVWETQVQFLGQEDSLEKEVATHSGILAWNVPWTEEPGRLQSMELDMTEKTFTFTSQVVLDIRSSSGYKQDRQSPDSGEAHMFMREVGNAEVNKQQSLQVLTTDIMWIDKMLWFSFIRSANIFWLSALYLLLCWASHKAGVSFLLLSLHSSCRDKC